jgi:hypothetical protein
MFMEVAAHSGSQGENRSRRSSAVPGTASRHYDNMGGRAISPLY